MALRIDSASNSQQVLPQPETVDVSTVSLFNSRCFKMLGTTVVLAASVTWILPAVLSNMEVAVDPQMIKALLGTLLTGALLIGVAGSNPRWDKMIEASALGAPLQLENPIVKLES